MVLFVHLQVSHPNQHQVVSAWCDDFTQIIISHLMEGLLLFSPGCSHLMAGFLLPSLGCTHPMAGLLLLCRVACSFSEVNCILKAHQLYPEIVLDLLEVCHLPACKSRILSSSHQSMGIQSGILPRRGRIHLGQ